MNLSQEQADPTYSYLDPGRFRSLHSRLHWRLHMDPLTPADTAEYLRYRMKRAGCGRDVFTHDAVQMLHEAAADGLRDLDWLTTGACGKRAQEAQAGRARPSAARPRP
jgi:general secretion pathway protein A